MTLNPGNHNAETPLSTQENLGSQTRKARAISALGVPQEMFLNRDSEASSARMSIRKSPFYQK